MRARTASRVAGSAATGSVALIIGGLLLAYADRDLVPGLTGWTVTNVATQLVNLAVPVAGFVVASGARRTGSAGCSWRRAPGWA